MFSITRVYRVYQTGYEALFSGTLKEICPELFISLRDEILPIYIKVKNSEEKMDTLISTLFQWTSRYNLNTNATQSDIFWTNMADSFRPNTYIPAGHSNDMLPDDSVWILNTALETLYYWSVSPKIAESLLLSNWNPSWKHPKTPNKTELDLSVFYWSPAHESRKAAEKRIYSYIQTYLDDIERPYIKEKSWDTTKRIRTPDHIKWLVYYQVKEWTYMQIAEYYENTEYGISNTAITHAVISTADLLGIKLRTAGLKGRPKENK